MKIRVYCICRNEERILPFFLRHYSVFADSIVVYDDESTDRTLEILATCPIVEVRKCPWKGLDDPKGMQLSQTVYKECIGQFDWVMWVDCDEFIWSYDTKQILEYSKNFDIPKVAAFNMVGKGLPVDYGRQIWEINPMGVIAPVYAKSIVFRPEFEMRWSSGRHHLENKNLKLSHGFVFRLLHYRYMGFEYTRSRNLNNLDRCSSENKGHAWTCTPNWKGEHSPEWAESSISRGFNVFDYDLSEYVV